MLDEEAGKFIYLRQESNRGGAKPAECNEGEPPSGGQWSVTRVTDSCHTWPQPSRGREIFYKKIFVTDPVEE